MYIERTYSVNIDFASMQHAQEQVISKTKRNKKPLKCET